MPPRQIELTTIIEEFDSPDELPADEKELLDAARAGLVHAYAPYSHFIVGAAVRTATGEIISGSNQENVVYKGTCAERTALDTAGHQGHRKTGGIQKIAIIGKPENAESDNQICPCGQCRQDIKEWEDLSGKPVIIIMASTRGKIWRVNGIESLLKVPFGPKDLGITLS